MNAQDQRALLDSIPTPIERDGSPARAYISSAGQVPGKLESLWRVYFAVDGGRQRQVVTQPMAWREAMALCHALNERAGLETVRER